MDGNESQVFQPTLHISICHNGKVWRRRNWKILWGSAKINSQNVKERHTDIVEDLGANVGTTMSNDHLRKCVGNMAWTEWKKQQISAICSWRKSAHSKHDVQAILRLSNWISRNGLHKNQFDYTYNNLKSIEEDPQHDRLTSYKRSLTRLIDSSLKDGIKPGTLVQPDIQSYHGYAVSSREDTSHWWWLPNISLSEVFNICNTLTYTSLDISSFFNSKITFAICLKKSYFLYFMLPIYS